MSVPRNRGYDGPCAIVTKILGEFLFRYYFRTRLVSGVNNLKWCYFNN